MYQAFAALFIAQAFNIEMSFAQQIFNLSSAQLPLAQQAASTAAATPEALEDDKDPNVYRSIRLDPNDLCTGLIGPYFVAFASREVVTEPDKHWFEDMFLSSISLPTARTVAAPNQTNVIEGISVPPDQQEEYAAFIETAREAIAKDKPGFGDFENAIAAIGEKFQIFARCPRSIFILTVPNGVEPPLNITDRIQALLDRLLPNQTKARIAIIYGTTKVFSMSIFFEGSVLFSPMVYRSITNYLALSFRKRNLKVAEFGEKLNALLAADRDGPIEAAEMEDLFEEKEDFARTVGNFTTLKANWLRAWQASKGDTTAVNDHTIDDLLLTREEIRSALNYLIYVRRYQKIEVI